MISLLLLACAPLDGPLAAGTWGGEHWSLVVEEDGTGTLETDCALGVFVDPLEAVDGELEAGLEWTPGGGAMDPQDPPDPEAATLTAQVTARHLSGVVAAEDGSWETEVDVRLGAEPVLFKCE